MTSLDAALPRFVANGISDEERPSSDEDHLDRLASTRAAMADQAIVTRPFAGYLDLLFVRPYSEGSFIWISYAQMEEARLTEAAIDEIAFRNLDTMIAREAKVEWVTDGTGVCFHNFASSFLLSRAFWNGVGVSKEQLTVIAPQRDMLAFCTSHSADGLAFLDSVRRKFWNDAAVSESAKLCEHFLVPDDAGADAWRLTGKLAHSN